ncbi:[FeFe] hydrogenase H-cluster radical SAM maturase HydE [Carboxylicivirga marina]|uniref:[FeFe] hydrogenase H-cluster radical SAM maturase HydE n=1 Tax=Carboxylicivirga marina TaxID=2800988 RepID=A0ABS1HH40_9BACT|nr:[FeFe] hydrogenase H-cluster radical SAM maturase HydE [Carboxylicivirga marina]MBK3517000.1 [FeFe] hydrogenase H-cluster radical SAM maturase HydE [Carboxylicivirga marina]
MSTERIRKIINNKDFTKENLSYLISLEGDERDYFLKQVGNTYTESLGKKVYFRGLVEFSNFCTKDCYYCGIRKSNTHSERYDIDNKAIVDAAIFAHENKYGSLVLQSGERSDKAFTVRITSLLKKIKEATNGELGITISLGEQSEETYRDWFEAGAHRYLLRIESSNQDLYYKIHPKDEKHNFETRIKCLKTLQKIGYQTGTGVMIGLPFQSYNDLADDLLFFKNTNIDMVGMGPFIEHTETPLYEHKDALWSLQRRFDVSLNMIATLRILMPDINMAAATALQAIDPMGREKALRYGANVIMPNITPTANRKDYTLYENKPCTDEGADDCANCLSIRVEMAGREIGYNEWGDSKHFFKRQEKK